MKRYHYLIFLIALVSAVNASAQSSISISSGVSKDIDNPKISFYHIPVYLIWRPGKKNFSPLVEVSNSFALAGKSYGNAYTLNPALPAKVSLQEKIIPGFYEVGFGVSIRLLTTKKSNNFNINVIPVGFCHQNIRVSYKNYDRQNYEVLNPDLTFKETTFMLATSIVYNFHKAKKDLMLMLHFQSNLDNNKDGYVFSYKPITPVQFTVGYNFYYNK